MEIQKCIFDYMDYRSFLNEYIVSRKKLNSSYSMRALASRIQCNPGFFNRILRGERNLMPAHIVELGKVIKFSRKEQQYFELLVAYNHSKKQNERDHYFEQLQQFKKTAVKQLDNDQYGLYSHWYFLVLRELLSIIVCKNGSDLSYREIGKMLNPPISSAEVKDALEMLLKMGVIKENQDGNLKPADSFTASGGGCATGNCKPISSGICRSG
ncbi:MAG TPA: TIGR02147 family protein [Chitinispirillaceae bacterium]|nr:TIGR02147 family protein [Chitinispirillaceae bacterium]